MCREAYRLPTHTAVSQVSRAGEAAAARGAFLNEAGVLLEERVENITVEAFAGRWIQNFCNQSPCRLV